MDEQDIKFPVHFYDYKSNVLGSHTIGELRQLAQDRISLLKIIENEAWNGNITEDDMVLSEGWKKTFFEKLSKLKMYKQLLEQLAENAIETSSPNVRNDFLAHTILRISFSQRGTHSTWFLKQELLLFRVRFLLQHPTCTNEFLKNYEEYEDTCYKTHFSNALKLVANRKVPIKNAYTIVRREQMVEVVVQRLETVLKKKNKQCTEKFETITDPDFLLMLKDLLKCYESPSYSCENLATINLENLDTLAASHFPLCMQHVHQTLRRNHHLKHGARRQYCVFLKGIGLSFEDCLQLWKEEFSQQVGQHLFNKKYSYHVKHTYGLVGSKRDYQPFNCEQIIQSHQLGPNDVHGCPFKSSDMLASQFASVDIEDLGRAEILKLTKTQPRKACSLYFELTKRRKIQVFHPNQYFCESFGTRNPSADYHYSDETNTLTTQRENNLIVGNKPFQGTEVKTDQLVDHRIDLIEKWEEPVEFPSWSAWHWFEKENERMPKEIQKQFQWKPK